VGDRSAQDAWAKALRLDGLYTWDGPSGLGVNATRSRRKPRSEARLVSYFGDPDHARAIALILVSTGPAYTHEKNHG